MANEHVINGATGGYRISIDSDNDSTIQTFEVWKDGANGTKLLELREDGRLVLHVGKGDFSAGSIRTKVVSSIPGVGFGAQDGDIVVLNNSTDQGLLVRIGGQWAAFTDVPVMCW